MQKEIKSHLSSEKVEKEIKKFLEETFSEMKIFHKMEIEWGSDYFLKIRYLPINKNKYEKVDMLEVEILIEEGDLERKVIIKNDYSPVIDYFLFEFEKFL